MQDSPFTFGCSPGQGAPLNTTHATYSTLDVPEPSAGIASGQNVRTTFASGLSAALSPRTALTNVNIDTPHDSQGSSARDGKIEVPLPAANDRGTTIPVLQEERHTIPVGSSRTSRRVGRRNADRRKDKLPSVLYDKEPLHDGGYRLVFQAGGREASFLEYHPQTSRNSKNDVSSADFSVEYHAVRALMNMEKQGSSTSTPGPSTASLTSLAKNRFSVGDVPVSSQQQERTQAIKEDVDIQVPNHEPAVIGTNLSDVGSANEGHQAVTRESTDSLHFYTIRSVGLDPLDNVNSAVDVLKQTPVPVATGFPQIQGILEDDRAHTYVPDEVLLSPGIIHNQNTNTEARRVARRKTIEELKAKSGTKPQTQTTKRTPSIAMNDTTEGVDLPNHVHRNMSWYQLLWTLLGLLLLGLYYNILIPTGQACLNRTPGVLNFVCNAVVSAAHGVAAARGCIRPTQPPEPTQHESHWSPQTANNDQGSLAMLTTVASGFSSLRSPLNKQHVHGANFAAPEVSRGEPACYSNPSATRLPPYTRQPFSPSASCHEPSWHSHSSTARFRRYTHQPPVPFAPQTSFREDRYPLTSLNAYGHPQTNYVYGDRARNLAKLDTPSPYRNAEYWDEVPQRSYNFS
ncbi:uncharacterized protein N0V89_001179 [Didymosphaeria variabile]|uniref:Uncharacterized protein n=1 Tax=Didymosphaeria variabile TaxID=1932322 RepID=A0A9W8XW19_9PLEO|nr:uncharacterized protein N0V89_001179 [Didymosphaeria variabile]KAJ4360613.1 hypothetical protein N0V89_001179 [Didymosphaeria variabile]